MIHSSKTIQPVSGRVGILIQVSLFAEPVLSPNNVGYFQECKSMGGTGFALDRRGPSWSHQDSSPSQRCRGRRRECQVSLVGTDAWHLCPDGEGHVWGRKKGENVLGS